MNPGNKRPVALDDLLRLKRTERPPQEFWTEFDRQLRAKQLAALVEKRPWWRSTPSLAVLWPRVRIPLGVATAVGIGLLSVRDSRRPAGVPVVVSEESSPSANFASAPTSSLAPLDVVVVSASVSSSSVAAAASLESVPAASLLAEPPTPVVADIVVQASLPAVSAVEAVSPPPPVLERALTVPALMTGPVAENRVALAPARMPIEPLQQMTPPGESRRARFLTAMVSTASVESSARISERAASRFAEDRLQDQPGRFGARGDRVNLKF